MEKLILIVDDNQMNLRLLSDLLTVRGYTTIEAVNGYEGVRLAKKMRPNLILMDIQMPVMDGLEATLKIKADPLTHNIPIVALTSFAMQGDKEKILETGCDYYLSKPIDTRDFMDLIDQIL